MLDTLYILVNGAYVNRYSTVRGVQCVMTTLKDFTVVRVLFTDIFQAPS